MKLRCKEGDIALVMRDEPQCKPNIGKLVRVAGPIKINQRGQATWLIEPVKKDFWYSLTQGKELSFHIVTFESGIEHQDEWLLPIDLSEGICNLLKQELDVVTHMQTECIQDFNCIEGL